jgi:tyrosyl-tRNA synthetase
MTLSEELQWRGFVNQTTFKDINAIDGDPITFYWGVDPSAPSMTIGNLAAAMMVRHFIDYGHKAVLLVGGATGMIGDPDGKAEERTLKTPEELAHNKEGISSQYSQVFGGKDFTLVDNFDWFKDVNYLEFLRDVGKHVPMRQMLGREFIQTRLGEEGSGISYAEFSYVLIQAYDFLHLHKQLDVTLQLCGSDQWGNSIAGVDLIRRLTGNEAHVWSSPLVINKTTGVKFGKSEDGAVWLDPSMTSVYQFYQFWLNVDDEGVSDYLKIYTLLPKEKIEEILQEFSANRASRIAQKTLAYEVTKIVHGQERADSVKRATEVLFGGNDYTQLEQTDFEMLATELPNVMGFVGDKLSAAILQSGLAGSTSDVRRFFEQGAIYLNGKQLTEDTVISDDDNLGSGYAVLKRGKNAMALLQIVHHPY